MLNFILGKDIAQYVKRHRGLVVCALILTGISSLFVVVPAYLLQPFVDEGMKSGSDPVVWKIPWIAFDQGSWFSWHKTQLVLVEGVSPNRLLVILTSVAFVSILFKSVTIYLSGLSAAAFSNRSVRSLRIDLFKKFVSLPLGFYHTRKTGELIARSTADLTVLQGLIANVLIGLIEYPLTALVFLFYLFFMNYRLTLLVFFVVPIIVGLIRLFGRKVKKHSTRVQDATSDVTSAYQEILLCLKVVHGFFMGDKEVKKFRGLANHLYKRVMHWSRWELGLGPMMDSTVFLVLPAILIVGKTYFHHSLGELMSMVYAFSRVYAPIKRLALVNNNLRTLQGATKRVFGIMDTVPSIQEMPGANTLPRHKNSILFDRVSFGYSINELVLRDISFEVKAGEMVAFVGSTGAGKSTLMDLIPRFYDVSGGAIRIDGNDIRDVRLESLRRQIGIVNQEVILFNDTIANNINYGHPEKNMDQIIEAAKAAYAHDFIKAQPEGYETVVGDQGVLLSGGQRQRIAIARAILIDPAVLILDEAASALDAESEKFVQEAIEKLKGSRTILVVAHRLSTVRRSNRIFVLEGGRIVESGTREYLLSINGRFRQLSDIQLRA
ncbi:MAG TPA: ABC transporter ATP-binding protein [Desulfobacteraceae bacterium]|nr:ABC transporter ATP-binding protein [Desulfobacteraceae bacterium]HPJ66340.1 ABC transporter ATP-binding protein [Desulfobacteraceae bacterium]HPQ27184.1 ABC transporter ATP-binding protein [Desulfobacteraceae bacterium]